MTAKEFVKKEHPNVRAERHVKGMIKGMQEVYWLIRPDRNVMYIAEGKSESNAWVNAKNNIIINKTFVTFT